MKRSWDPFGKWLCLNLREPPNVAPKSCILVGKQWFLAAMAREMPREVKVNTLEGGVFTVKVLPANTIEELKAMLREKKHCEDPIERQILKVEVLVNTLLVDDDQTLESAGLLHAQSEVTVIYSRNEVEAASKRGNPCRGPPPSQHPILSHGNSCWSLSRPKPGGKGDNPRVCDSYCKWRLCPV